ncbi:hypothetical protein M513_01167 [Trichuris suis]|uniref:Uncharacterized protein n=1 Tax=Trichuris suis TaxID=68888 RepID=A0A085ML38_9BILA|nr:hypothetical protein M513_01167 [Trichuris suis]
MPHQWGLYIIRKRKEDTVFGQSAHLPFREESRQSAISVEPRISFDWKYWTTCQELNKYVWDVQSRRSAYVTYTQRTLAVDR